ncbi:OadG family protein [Sulfurovum sp. bin170]|uniref:OadG family protein n=1 Tax=Sulfurovum sp. bin170 TaxID=2695268 RepID=UPI0013DFBD9A|nr:OadG family protein [Sulfurovum sp. bin170]NEW59697.1 OadG family protein [Sulfurovum sp. bin170]
MEEVNLLAESFKFMILGMSVVFLFLIALVQFIKLQAYLINKYFPEAPPAPATPVANTSEDENKRVAAIIAAVSEFRKNKS